MARFAFSSHSTMKTTSFARARGFTLIEMLVVITIIIILGSLVVGGLGYVNARQAQEKARVQIALLGKGIEEYKADMGIYPGESEHSPVDGKISEELYEQLFYDGYDYQQQSTPPADWGKATKPYVPELNPASSKMGWVTSATPPPTSVKIVDPWGNEYRYRKGNSAINPDFDLWSAGKDGETDDSPTAKAARDDIRN